MVFCNLTKAERKSLNNIVTILILIDGFLQSEKYKSKDLCICVTILILIDGFLQLSTPLGMVHHKAKSQSLF